MDNQIIFIILGVIGVILGGFYMFVYIVYLKIEKLENRIKQLFISRSDSIPGMFEISKKYLSRHSDVFKESIRLRKVQLILNHSNTPFYKVIETEGLLHHELNFIFTACNKHVSLTEQAKFNYMKEIIIDKSGEIGSKMGLYKNIVKTFNRLIKIKNCTLLGFFIPIDKKVVL